MNTPHTTARPSLPEVSLARLYGLRAVYLFVVIGLASVVWPAVLDVSHRWPLMDGVVSCMLAAFSLLCLLGLRYPLAMLPVLLWELLWKSLWLLRVALPDLLAHRMDAATEANLYACLLVVIIPAALPWRYVLHTYVLRRGERWR